MELGLHIADFTWSGGAPVLGRTLASHARSLHRRERHHRARQGHRPAGRGAARTRM